MNKFLLSVLVILFLMSCKKEYSKECNGGIDCPGQIIICHNGNLISINTNAWPAHQYHGDIRLDDEDGDGYVPENDCGFGSMGDCDDNNEALHPGAAEICANNIDDNCNGEIDENCLASIVVCNQVWTVKNLDVTTYRNGDAIPQVTNPAAWASLTTGAWCYYFNDPANGASYGKLYNWYAVNDPRGLAPAGWHIPTLAEWETLVDCLGGMYVAGGKLKETDTTHWLDPNTAATNETGFTALPGNMRSGTGEFRPTIATPFLGISGNWWTISEYIFNSIVYASHKYIVNYEGSVQNGIEDKACRFSVRCVKD
jgi:uncharacterized protein (TIGR02145 family)